MCGCNKMSLLRAILFLGRMGFIVGTEMCWFFFVSHDRSLLVRRLASRLASINILYVKIFQALALNNSLIDETMDNELVRFTDHAPWSIQDIDFETLIEMTDKFDIQLQGGCWESPVNAGMISLVFKGIQRSSQQPIVVKIKRKHIQQTLDEAIGHLLFVVSVVSWMPVIRNYQLADVVVKNIEVIRHQTNFLAEVENMEKVRKNCKHLQYVKIPFTVRLATEQYPNVILMEYLEGKKVHDIAEEDYDGFAKQVVKFGLVTTMLHGTVHGDLHSGNILFIKDPRDSKYPHKIGVLDFGIVHEMGGEYKAFLFDIFTNMFEVTPRETAERILMSSILQPPGILQCIPQQDYQSILVFVEEIVAETIHSSKKANQLQIYRVLSRFREYVTKKELMNLGIRLSDDFVKSQLVLAMSHGVTLRLCKGDFMTLCDRALNELFPVGMFQ